MPAMRQAGGSLYPALRPPAGRASHPGLPDESGTVYRPRPTGQSSRSFQGFGNDVLIPGQPFQPQQRHLTRQMGFGTGPDPEPPQPQGRPNSLRGVPMGQGGGQDSLFWEPSMAAPQEPVEYRAPRAARRIIPNQNGPGALRSVAPGTEVFNSGGYWHDPSGMTGQAANEAMGGRMIYGVGEGGSAGSGQAMQAYRDRMGGRSAGPQAMAGTGGSGGIGAPWEQMMNAANAANENRYNEVLGGWSSGRRYADSLLDKLGIQQRKDTNQIFDNNEGRIQQSMVDRGLTNTSVLDNHFQGNATKRGDALARLEESLAQQRLDTELGLLEKQLGFMERREDVAPDMGLLAQLMQQYGAGGGGAGGGGIVNMGGAGYFGGSGMGYGGGGYGMPAYSPRMYRGDSGSPGPSNWQAFLRNFNKAMGGGGNGGPRQHMVFGPDDGFRHYDYDTDTLS